MEGARALRPERNRLQLAGEAAARDWDPFELLMKQHSARIFRLALRMLGNPEDAEDVQQETFIRAHRARRQFRGDASFGTWIYAIAARLCLSKKRRSARRRELASERQPAELPDAVADPEQHLLARESAARVQRALAALSPSHRLLIVLKYIEGLSHEEIARVLRCSVASSRSRLLRAKRLFRERYQEVE